MKLYGYWRSTAAYRVRIALALKGLDVEHVAVDLVKEGGEQHQLKYRTINPQGLVPALEIDGNVLTQSMAILEYLEEQYPEPSILSDDLSKRAQIRAFAHSITCDIHPLNNLRILQYLKGTLAVTEEQKMDWYQHWIATGFKALEATIASSDESYVYCFGDTPSMADICLVAQIYNANRFNVALDDYPKLRRINETCLQLDTFKSALPENQADAS